MGAGLVSSPHCIFAEFETLSKEFPDKALNRLLYRAWQVCQTPNEILVDKLGLDIPPAPEVTLEEISAREIRIAWKQPEFHNSIHKHIIQINGAKGIDYDYQVALNKSSWLTTMSSG